MTPDVNINQISATWGMANVGQSLQYLQKCIANPRYYVYPHNLKMYISIINIGTCTYADQYHGTFI
jgi:hypothetical protein